MNEDKEPKLVAWDETKSDLLDYEDILLLLKKWFTTINRNPRTVVMFIFSTEDDILLWHQACDGKHKLSDIPSPTIVYHHIQHADDNPLNLFVTHLCVYTNDEHTEYKRLYLLREPRA